MLNNNETLEKHNTDKENKFRFKSKLPLIFYSINVVILYIVQSPQTSEEIGGIFGGAIVPFSIGYLFFWLFTFKIKDKKSIKFLTIGSLGFLVGLFVLFLLIFSGKA